MINALQHVGMGVNDTDTTYAFYRDTLGFKIKLNDHTEYSQEMAPIIGDVVEMRMLMAMNIHGGGAIELIEHTSTEPRARAEPVRWGDLGFLESGLWATNLDALVPQLQAKGVALLTPVCSFQDYAGATWKYAYLRDPDGLLLQLLERPGSDGASLVGGISHVAVGVSDIEAAERFYGEVLGYDRAIYRFTGYLPEMDAVTGGPMRMKMTILERSQGSTSQLALLDGGLIKLVQAIGYQGRPIFEGRRWGDIGQMEVALDVTDLRVTLDEALSKGATLLHPPTFMDMGSGSVGSFAYITDPDGNIIEFVEVEKIAWVSPQVMSSVLIRALKLLAKMKVL